MVSVPDSLPQPTRFWHSGQKFGSDAWREAVQPHSLCLNLNFHGEGRIQLTTGQSFAVRPQRLSWSRDVRTAIRLGSRDRHECLTLVYPDNWLTESLREAVEQASKEGRELITPPFAPIFIQGRPLTAGDLTWAKTLMAPHLCSAARRLLDTARLTDFLVRELFTPADEPFTNLVSRAERAALERVEKVKAHVLQQLDDPQTLESLARIAGCSPHYLSRTFAQMTGLSLMLWIRRVRIERAAELIASGRCNVSEAALEVGYRSFSHFSRAFGEEKGVPPSKWIAHLTTQRQA